MSAGDPLRVLFATIAHNTHFYSMVPLAWALRAAGHEVRVASTPGMADVITRAGLTAVPVGRDPAPQALRTEHAPGSPTVDFTDLLPGPDHEWLLGFHTMLVPTFFATLNDDALVDGLVEAARAWEPDLVVWEPLTLAGGVAATVSGAAHARLLWGPDVLGLARQQFLEVLATQPPERRDDPLAEWLGWTLERHGHEFSETVVRGHWVIDQEPPSVRLPVDQRTVPMRYVPYNGPAVVPDWVFERRHPRRVCVSLGVSARSGRGSSTVGVGDLLAALSEVDTEVVATLDATQRQGLGAVPDNVRLVDFVPLHVLLPTCSAIVHHGGAGTWGTALRYGVPQILVPEIWDAPLRGRLLSDLGAGLVQSVGELTPDSLRDKVMRALDDPALAGAARALQTELAAEPAPTEVVGELERLTRRYREGS
ncbi:activator-dependent family glycosyltransferase [Prauserella oleivorans]|uniref:Activator-dependent family glycosyltransferase n=1 Tax=Prauserella oleivorans TaxID=1478153 RepID=A0ABW5W638_9PSEU